jgi:hypothetical protein
LQASKSQENPPYALVAVVSSFFDFHVRHAEHSRDAGLARTAGFYTRLRRRSDSKIDFQLVGRMRVRDFSLGSSRRESTSRIIFSARFFSIADKTLCGSPHPNQSGNLPCATSRIAFRKSASSLRNAEAANAETGMPCVNLQRQAEETAARNSRAVAWSVEQKVRSWPARRDSNPLPTA